MSWVEIGDTDEELQALYCEIEMDNGCGITMTEERLVQMRNIKLDCHFFIYTNGSLHACLGIKKASADLKIYAVQASTNASTQEEYEEIVDAYADKVKAYLQEREEYRLYINYSSNWAERVTAWKPLMPSRFLAKDVKITDDGQLMIMELV